MPPTTPGQDAASGRHWSRSDSVQDPHPSPILWLSESLLPALCRPAVSALLVAAPITAACRRHPCTHSFQPLRDSVSSAKFRMQEERPWVALFGWGPLVHSAMGARPRGAVMHSHACEDTPPVPSRMRETDIEMKRHTRTERCPHRKGSTVIGPGPPSADSGTRTQRRRLWPLPPLLLHCYLPWSVLTFGLC